MDVSKSTTIQPQTQDTLLNMSTKSISDYNLPLYSTSIHAAADTEIILTQANENLKLIHNIIRYRTALILTWAVNFFCLACLLGWLIYSGHGGTPPASPNDTTNSTHAIDSINYISRSLQPRYVPFRCITGFTTEQLQAGLEWMEKQAQHPDRISSGKGCKAAVPVTSLEQWQFNVDIIFA